MNLEKDRLREEKIPKKRQNESEKVICIRAGVISIGVSFSQYTLNQVVNRAILQPWGRLLYAYNSPMRVRGMRSRRPR